MQFGKCKLCVYFTPPKKAKRTDARLAFFLYFAFFRMTDAGESAAVPENFGGQGEGEVAVRSSDGGAGVDGGKIVRG